GGAVERAGVLDVLVAERQETAPEAATCAVAMNREENGVEPSPEMQVVLQRRELQQRPQRGLLKQIVPIRRVTAEAPRRQASPVMDGLKQSQQALAGAVIDHLSAPGSVPASIWKTARGGRAVASPAQNPSISAQHGPESLETLAVELGQLHL